MPKKCFLEEGSICQKVVGLANCNTEQEVNKKR